VIDVEPLIEESFDRLYPRSQPAADWGDVLARGGVPTRRGGRSRLLVLAAAAVVVAVVVAATPLGAAIGRGLWSFPAWLVGEPGKPAAPAAQRAFARENARSWSGFPTTPKLRELIRTSADGVDYVLYGFRSGGSLCLRVVVSGAVRGKGEGCAPLSDLRSRPAPALAIQVDDSFGTIPGKHVRIGIDTYSVARASASFGIVADAVQRVELRSDDATRRALLANNAFLSVASRPRTGARVRTITATVAGGRAFAVPFAQAPFDTTAGSAPAGRLHGPSHVERQVRGGRIGWLDRRESRGDPLPAGFPDPLRGLTARRVFGRLIQPDPLEPLRVALSVYRVSKAPRYTFMKPGLVICNDLVSGRAVGGGCSQAAQLFEGGPFSFGTMTLFGGDQYGIVDGVASDDVARLRLFFGDGGVAELPLRDNVFVMRVSRARYPIRLVAYDAQGRVIGIESRQPDGTTPRWARPDPSAHWRIEQRIVDADGNPATLYTKPSLTGTVCWSVRMHGGGGSNGCLPPRWSGPALQLGYVGDPPDTAVLEGRVRRDVTRLVLQRRSGAREAVIPRDGFVLVAVPHGDPFVEISGYNRAGTRVGRFKPLVG
jgi:hypothetical protein